MNITRAQIESQFISFQSNQSIEQTKQGYTTALLAWLAGQGVTSGVEYDQITKDLESYSQFNSLI